MSSTKNTSAQGLWAHHSYFSNITFFSSVLVLSKNFLGERLGRTLVGFSLAALFGRYSCVTLPYLGRARVAQHQPVWFALLLALCTPS